MVQAQTELEEQHAWKYVPAYPWSLCQLEKQNIHQLLTRYTALVKKRSCHPGFCLDLHPGLLWHSRSIWIGTSITELCDAVLKKTALFFLLFFWGGRLCSFLLKPSLPFLFCLLFMSSKTSWEDVRYYIILAFSIKKYIQASSLCHLRGEI